MRLLLVHNRYRSATPGGEDRVFEQEASLLRDAGHEVVTYIRSNDEMNEGRVVDKTRVLLGMQRSGRTVRDLTALIERSRPEVAHFHNTFPLISLSGHDVCRRTRIPVVQTVHNFRMVCPIGVHFRDGAACEECRPGSPWAAVRHRCYRASSSASLAVAAMTARNHFFGANKSWVDRYVVLGEFAKSRLLAAGIDSDRILIKPNFVDPAERFWADAGAGEVEVPYALFVGRLSSEKALLSLLRAWVGLRDLPLRVVGTGPDLHAAQRIASDLKLDVTFMGFLDARNVRQQMTGARALVLSDGCYEAGVPLVVIEAWSVGTPVVAPAIGSMKSLSNGVDSLLYEPADNRSLSRMVREVWSNAVVRRQISQGGLARWRRDHSPAVSLESLVTLYRALLP